MEFNLQNVCIIQGTIFFISLEKMLKNGRHVLWLNLNQFLLFAIFSDTFEDV